MNLKDTESFDVKIVDYGFSMLTNESFLRNSSKMISSVGNQSTKAPEVDDENYNIREYDKRIDVWAVGVAYYILITGCMIF